jgi:GNAT superfamily N-acetyltransferase
VSDLELLWWTSPSGVPSGLPGELTACWRDVVNAGGAVGFGAQRPVSDDVVAPAVAAVVAALDAERSRLLVARRDDMVAGWALLGRNPDPVVAHWGRVTHVQTALDARGTGVGAALMTEVARSAREDLCLELLRLEVRGGMGLEAFYERFGWRVVGAWPRALRFPPDDVRDEVLMSLDLQAAEVVR